MSDRTLTERARALFTENLNLKLVSLFGALVLYSLVHGAQDAQRAMSVDLVVVLPPDTANRVLVSPLPPQVRVTLRSSQGKLDELRTDDIGNLQVDVHTGQDKRVMLDKTMVHVPAGVTVEQIDPPTIDFQWDDVILRDVPVQVSVVGTPAPGYVVKGVPAANPKDVRVRGPKSELSTIQFARAEAFDVSGLTAGNYSHALAIDHPGGRVTFDTRTVNVATEIMSLTERNFIKLAVAVTGKSHAKTTPGEVDVRLSCPPDIANALREEQVVPRVEIKNAAGSGSESLTVIVGVDKCEAHVTPNTVIVKW